MDHPGMCPINVTVITLVNDLLMIWIEMGGETSSTADTSVLPTDTGTATPIDITTMRIQSCSGHFFLRGTTPRMGEHPSDSNLFCSLHLGYEPL